MQITTKGAVALKQLRQQLQEDAGQDFPEDVLTELLVLHDVCKSLDLNVFQTKEVLGEAGWQGVAAYINSPACAAVNWNRISEVDDRSTTM